MTREEMNAKMAEARDKAETKASEWNEANLENKPVDDIKAIETAVDEAIKDHLKYARMICFDICLEAEDPMVKACELLDFDAIKSTITEDNDAGTRTMTIDDCKKPVDLKKFAEYAKKRSKTIGHDTSWPLAVEKFNMLMTLDRAVQLGVSPERIKEINDSYAIRDMAKQWDEGKNIISNTQELKSLAGVIQMMIGDAYKPVSHDLKYLHMIYTKKGKGALKVSCANHNLMRRYLQEICHRLITGKSYDVEFKVVKK